MKAIINFKKNLKKISDFNNNFSFYFIIIFVILLCDARSRVRVLLLHKENKYYILNISLFILHFLNFMFSFTFYIFHVLFYIFHFSCPVFMLFFSFQNKCSISKLKYKSSLLYLKNINVSQYQIHNTLYSLIFKKKTEILKF